MQHTRSSIAGLVLACTLVAAQTAQAAGTLTVCTESSPDGFDIMQYESAVTNDAAGLTLYDQLLMFKPGGTELLPGLAESWTVSPDLKVYTFKLRKGVKFHNGEDFNAAAVKFSFERAVGKDSVNKDKAVFANIEKIETPDPYTVVLNLKNGSIDLPFQLGQGTAIIVEPKSAATNGTQPVGTGPYRLETWNKGSSVVLTRWDGHRNAKDVKLRRVTIRFISDAAAQVAALLSGDVDAFPRVAAQRSLKQFQDNKKFQVILSGSRAKTILAINNKRKPLDNVLVRRAIYAAIDRKAVIEGAADGLGVPIGSFYTPSAPGYVDTTGINPFDQARARALLHQAGITPPLELTMKLPPVSYARQGGEVIAAQLAKVGIVAKIENVEWAQWMSGVYGQKAYDLTIVSHVEPLDFGNFARPNYYWGYESKAFNELWAKINATIKPDERNKLMADAQKLVAEEAVAAYLFQPTGITIANARVKGLWKDAPLSANDLAAISWGN